jgi:hypothetical protein
MKVGGLIAVLQTYDPNAEVMINGDSGTPDPCSLPNRIDTVFFLQDENGNQVLCTTGEEVDDLEADGYKIISKSPLLWRSRHIDRLVDLRPTTAACKSNAAVV